MWSGDRYVSESPRAIHKTFRHIQLKLTKIPTCSALPVFWKMCLNAALNQIAMDALPIARNSYLNVANTCQNMVAKRNLIPPLRALQSVRASSAAFALSAELRLARRYQQAEEKRQRQRQIMNFAAIKRQKKGMPSHKSKSVAAHPFNRPFAATHMLFYPTLTPFVFIKVLVKYQFNNTLRFLASNG